MAEGEAYYRFHALSHPYWACYIFRISRYRLISGIESITSTSTAAITTALTSLLIMSCTVPFLRSMFVEDFLHRPYRMRQGGLYRL